jgi:hypothetical protein
MSNSISIKDAKNVLETLTTMNKHFEDLKLTVVAHFTELNKSNCELSAKLDMLLQELPISEDIKKTKKKPKPVKVDEDTKEVVEPTEPVEEVKETKKTKTKREMNKMEFFNLMYDSNENHFSQYVTEAVKKELQKVNKEAWDKLSGDKLKAAKKSATYHYMKNNYDSELLSMKNNYLEVERNKSIKLVSADTSDE